MEGCSNSLPPCFPYLALQSPTKGGATVFPMADLTNKRMAAAGKTPGTDEVWYCQEEEVLGVRPAPGDAVLFW